MKLIIIYGPPAVGKLTVARELSKRLGDIEVYHNHVSLDPVKEIMEFDSEGFWEKVEKIRTERVKKAAEENQDIIMTFCYEESDAGFISNLEDIVRSAGGDVYFVQLKCDKDEILRRVEGDSRSEFSKVKSAQKLAEILDEYDYLTSVVHKEHLLIIDNTNISAENVADKICEEFCL